MSFHRFWSRFPSAKSLLKMLQIRVQGLKETTSEGYQILMTIHPLVEDRSIFHEATRLFEILNPAMVSVISKDRVYDLGIDHGEPSRSVLVGYPIPLIEFDPDHLARQLIRSWITCVEALSDGRAKAVAAVAFGKIDLRFGIAAHGFPVEGVTFGPTYHKTFKAFKNSILVDPWAQFDNDHKIIMSIEAVKKLTLSTKWEKISSEEGRMEEIFVSNYRDVVWKILKLEARG